MPGDSGRPSLVGCAVGEWEKVRLYALLPASGLYGTTFAQKTARRRG